CSKVNLSIYNVIGQKVRTLVHRRQPAGNYQVRWEGTNEKGKNVSSGI
ncbi:MAG: hypothetical protein GWN59_07860, partial [Calditrichae bacterium]|nr:hypothetical protein [Calditrichia bacterium]NIV73098.1 hypothetical protein [Calditrichia bacterium]